MDGYQYMCLDSHRENNCFASIRQRLGLKLKRGCDVVL